MLTDLFIFSLLPSESKEKTQPIPLISINDCKVFPLPKFPGYAMMGLSLGKTEASTIWIYFIPTIYANALANLII